MYLHYNFFIAFLFVCYLCHTGESATRMAVSEGRKVATCCTGPKKQELLRLCDESETLTNQLADLGQKGQVFCIFSASTF